MTRLEKFRAKIPKDTDACLITSELNNRYLSGLDYTDGFLLITHDEAFLFADSRYIEAAKKVTAETDFEAVLLSKRKSSLIKALLPSGSVIGYEDHIMSCFELDSLKEAMQDYSFAPMGKITEELRSVKDGSEKESIIKAQRIAEAAFSQVLNIISYDVTEADIAVELEYLMRKNGADGIAFDTICVSGKNSSLPHGIPSREKLRPGFLTMDFGAKYNGYCSDMTRTVCLGNPTEEMKHLYGTVLKAQEAALEYVSAGKRCCDVDKIARDIIDNGGYKGCFGHSLGHGVGLYIHEPISLSPLSEQALKCGNVVTVEPGIYVEGKYGDRNEDMVYVTENGCENLTSCNKELIVL